MAYEIHIRLELIKAYLEFHVRRNGGEYPDWLHPMDLIALNNLAEAWSYQREYQADHEVFRREMSLGNENVVTPSGGD